MQAPEFWNHRSGPEAAVLTRTLLEPVSWIYQAGAKARAFTSRAYRPPAPIVCVGNVTLGGVGKTPVSLAILKRLKTSGVAAHALTRGYGGKLRGPVQVDEDAHDFADVGDEPLLLSRTAPTWVAKNKAAGARAASNAGAEVVVMDDGFQNPTVAKDLCLVLIDAEAGLGNGRVFPAGPLREGVSQALERADAVVLMGATEDSIGDYWSAQIPSSATILTAHLTPSGPIPAGPVSAFAGIGRPQKFFDALHLAGADLKATTTYPDHHPYSDADVRALRDTARRHNALMITTEKDHVRLPKDLRRIIHAWPVIAEFDQPEKLDILLEKAMDRAATA